MTIPQLDALHLLVTVDKHPAGCASSGDMNDVYAVDYDARHGVYLLGAEGARTAEGIGAGSTLPEVMRAYPHSALSSWPDLQDQYQTFGDLFVQVPDNPAAEYVVMFDHHGKTRYVYLKLKAEQDC